MVIVSLGLVEDRIDICETIVGRCTCIRSTIVRSQAVLAPEHPISRILGQGWPGILLVTKHGRFLLIRVHVKGACREHWSMVRVHQSIGGVIRHFPLD